MSALKIAEICSKVKNNKFSYWTVKSCWLRVEIDSVRIGFVFLSVNSGWVRVGLLCQVRLLRPYF